MGRQPPGGPAGELGALPPHFERERRLLQQEGVTSWLALAALEEASLRRLGRAGLASEARLIRLRAQARLVCQLGLQPAEAALLLHAGVAEVRALAEADPQRLWLQVGRLQRRLTGLEVAPPSLATLRNWIGRARTRSSRPGN